MLRKLLPVLLALAGLGGGTGAGLFLRPAPEAGGDHVTQSAAPTGEHGDDVAEASSHEGEPEYVKMNNQFVVRVV